MRNNKITNSVNSDHDNAVRFLQDHRQRLRYAPDAKQWLVHDGKRWKRDTMLRVMELAVQTRDKMFADASKELSKGNAERAAVLTKNALKLGNQGPMKAMVNMAAETAGEQDGIKVSFSDLDRNPKRLNCQNGVVNLETGDLKKHDPAQNMMSITFGEYHKDAECPKWEQFLKDIFGGDEDLIRYVQRCVGYSLTASVEEQVAFFLYGTGSNGKSTFCEVIQELVGDYGGSFPFDSLMKSRNGGDSARAGETPARLMGTRFAITSETQNAKQIDEAKFKRWTGGDTIQANFLYKGAFDMVPTFKIWMSVNHLPTVGDASEGFWRRVRVIPFLQKFSFDQGNRDNKLKRELLAMERDGILRWAIDGAMLYFKHGLDEPKVVTDFVNNWREESDLLMQYLNQHCEVDPSHCVPLSELHREFCEFSALHRSPEPSHKMFSKQLDERQIERRRKASGNVVCGYRIVTPVTNMNGGDF